MSSPGGVNRLLSSGFLLLLCLFGVTRPCFAQQADAAPAVGAALTASRDPESMPRPVARANRATGRIEVDGLLDEAAWAAADSLDRFVQSQPRAGQAASEATVVRILYDDNTLYIGAHCYDSEPNHFVVTTLEKDFPGESTRGADVFGFTLDTFHDRRNSFIYLVNPLGALRDGQTFDDSRDTNFNWDGPVRVKTQTHARGYTVEVAIPWSTLRFDPSRADQVWGLNFLRRVRRKNEDSYWAPLDRRDPVHRMSKAGTLIGLGGVRGGGRNLSLKPYLLAGRSTGPSVATTTRGGEADAGLDLKYGVTPRLTADLTLRTDFSQVEVDQEQVNLTRFGVFFPEKRDFFVENSGVFSFGDISERNYRAGSTLRDFTLFHSRRIGLTRDGQPIPIVGGGRVTGRVGDTRVGLLSMQTERTERTAPENFVVARFRQPLRRNLEIGGIGINRQATDAGPGQRYNRSFGADADWRPFAPMIVHGYLAGTATPDTGSGDHLAGRVLLGWRDRLWDASAFWKHTGDAFDPGVGFVRRRGLRHTYATLGVHPRPSRLPGVQELNPYLELDYITDLHSVLDTRNLGAGLGIEFRDGGTANITHGRHRERLDREFGVVPGASIPVGSYDFAETGVEYASNAARHFSGTLRLATGGFYNGSKTSALVRALWRPNPHLSTDVYLDRNQVELPDTTFRADLLGARVKYAHSVRLFGSALVQYNAAAEQAIANVRVQFIHAALSDLFLVYTERWDLSGKGTLERVLTAKATRYVGF